MVLHITNDLMMSSTARSHADSQNVQIKFANSLSQAGEFLSNGECQLCLADLQMPGLNVEKLAELIRPHEIKSIVYVQHVNVDLLSTAKEQGFTEVMTRGQFNKSLGKIIADCKDSTT